MQPKIRRHTFVRFVAITSCLFVLASVWGYCWSRTGDATAALRLVGGQRIFIKEEVINLGFLGTEQETSLDVEFVNIGWNECSISGSRRSCGCIATSTLPLIIKPFDAKTVSVKISTLREGGPFEHSVEFFVSDPTLRKLSVTIKGETLLSLN
jgi:hypothetical protein